MTNQPSIHLITGYLGSGKTQFLSRLLEGSLFTEKIAVIVNDFGTIMFDGMRLSASREGVEVLEVPGGCLCCSAINDFQTALAEVVERGARRIFIEATGLADAAQVQRDLAFMNFPIDSTLCIVDALNLKRFQSLFHIVNAQIKAADFLLISKSDLIKKPETINNLEWELRTLNPRAATTRLSNGRAETKFLLQAFAPAEHFTPTKHEDSQEHLLHDSITAFRIGLPTAIDFAAFERILTDLPSHLIRLKGVIRFGNSRLGSSETDNSRQAVIVNFVAGAWNYQPLEAISSLGNELFLIGQNLSLADISVRFQELGARIEVGTVRRYSVF